MRVTLIVPGGVGRDGRTKVIPALLDLVAELASHHELQVVALRQEEKPATYDLLGAKVVNIGSVEGIAMPSRFLKRLWRVLQVVRPFRPDVIHAYWVGTTSTLAIAVAQWLRCPTVVSVAGGEFVRIPEASYGGLSTLSGRLHGWIALHGAEMITVGSAYAAQHLLKRKVSAKVVPLGVGIPTKREPCRGPVLDDSGTLRLIQVADLRPVKDQMTLLKALAILRERGRNVSLSIIGYDTMEGSLQETAHRLGVASSVAFTGQLPHEEVLLRLEQSQVFVQTSLHEAQGVAVGEAARAGLAIVGSAVGTLDKLAPHGAVTVPLGDPGALADALMAVADDPQWRSALGNFARVWAIEHDPAWTTKRFSKLYDKLVHPQPVELTSSPTMARTRQGDHRRIPFLGLPFVFECEDSRLLQVIDRHFAPWVNVSVSDTTPNRIRLALRARVDNEQADLKRGFVLQEATYSASMEGALLTVDGEGGEALAVLEPSWLGNERSLERDILEAACCFIAMYRDRTPLHASGVVWGDRAILFAGPSGAGKSTLAYACLRRGFDLLADGAVYVSLRNGLRVWGNPRGVLMSQEAMAHFPELSGMACKGEKVLVDPFEFHDLKRAFYSDSIIVCLLLPPEPGKEACIEPVAPDALYEALVSNPEPGFDLAMNLEDVASALSRSGGFALRRGDDPEVSVDLLKDMLFQGRDVVR